MKIVIYLLLSFSYCHGFIIESSKVGFTNTTFNCPPEMINNFINFANSASSFFRGYIKSELQYIKQNMEKLYKKPGTNFIVFIQNDTVVTDYMIAQGISGGTLSNINRRYPMWSYYFMLKQATEDRVQFKYLSNGIIGDGITPQMYKLIQTSIKLYEQQQECTCKQTNNVLQSIMNLTGYFWQGVCDNKGASFGYVATFNQLYAGRYGTFKPRSCYYTLFLGP